MLLLLGVLFGQKKKMEVVFFSYGDLIDSVLANLVGSKVVLDPFFRLQNLAIMDIVDSGRELHILTYPKKSYKFLFFTIDRESWDTIH